MGFTPGSLPLEGLILDGQQKEKEKKESHLGKIKSSEDSSKTVSVLQSICLLTQASK